MVTDSGISNDRCKITVVRAFARNKKDKFFSTILWKFTSASDGKKKRYQYQHYSPPTILYTVIIIIKLNELQLNVRDSHFLQLVSSYENLLKVYESCFSLKFDRLCNKGLDWIFLLFPADTLRKADVT